MKTHRMARGLLHGLLILFGIVWIYPFVWMVSSSFKTDAEYFNNGLSLLPDRVRWDNYVRAWETANFSQYFQNSVVLTVSTVAIVVMLCALTGYALGRVSFFGRKIFVVAISSTLFIPKGFTIIPIYLLVKELGLLNSMPGVILAESGGAHVLFILLFMAHFAKLPKELEESAEMDGCGFVRTFWSIMLPLSKPMLACMALFIAVTIYNDYTTPLFYTSKPSLETLQLLLKHVLTKIEALSVQGAALSSKENLPTEGIKAATIVVAIAPILLAYPFVQKYFISGVWTGAMKE